MSVLVDSNVLLDIFTTDSAWFGWSSEHLQQAADDAILVINPIVYAEVSVGFDTIEDLDLALPPSAFTREGLPWEAGFLAAKAHVSYRRRGGTTHATLPDFYIGAHAAVRGYTLLTRDPRRYRTAYPSLELIAP